MFVSPTKIVLTLTAVIAMTICCSQESNAQRGFRIGNVLQAGGGQGFRLGGDRFGMQFGGGQGAIIGGQNGGMRFGNGQGARFGTSSFGMQFGGGQGTQIGRLSTPSGFYNGAVQNQAYRQPVIVGQPVVGQPYVAQSYETQTVQPLVASPIAPSYSTGPNQGVVTSSYSQQIAGFPQGVTQVDIARAAVEADEAGETEKNKVENKVEASESIAPANGLIKSLFGGNAAEEKKSSPAIVEEKDEIRLMFSASEKEPFQYKVNGSERIIGPGETVLMEVGKQWKIEFDAGGELGGREAILNEGGVFAFEKSETQGWVLMKNPRTQPAKPDVPDNGGDEELLEN